LFAARSCDRLNAAGGFSSRDTDASSLNLTFTSSHGMFDKSHQFVSHMFSVVGQDWSGASSQARLCLGAQLSVDRLHQVPDLLNIWDGPASIAVFAPEADLTVATKYISFLNTCHPHLTSGVVFHFSYPAHHPGRMVDLEWEAPLTRCKQPEAVLKELLHLLRDPKKTVWSEDFRYPQNLQRNLAKHGCPTNYTMISDIDMVPGYPNMYRELEQFLRGQEGLQTPCTKCAYVVPTYEISSKAPRLPTGKNELQDFIKKKLARRFLIKMTKLNQGSSNLARWEGMPQTDLLDIAYPVEKYQFKYEPIFIARADFPDYDERFVGFGKGRVSQVYEMVMAGYRFHVLNNAFTNHWGFQNGPRSESRLQQYKENDARFLIFKKEISVRYPALDHMQMAD